MSNQNGNRDAHSTWTSVSCPLWPPARHCCQNDPWGWGHLKKIYNIKTCLQKKMNFKNTTQKHAVLSGCLLGGKTIIKKEYKNLCRAKIKMACSGIETKWWWSYYLHRGQFRMAKTAIFNAVTGFVMAFIFYECCIFCLFECRTDFGTAFDIFWDFTFCSVLHIKLTPGFLECFPFFSPLPALQYNTIRRHLVWTVCLSLEKRQ